MYRLTATNKQGEIVFVKSYVLKSNRDKALKRLKGQSQSKTWSFKEDVIKGDHKPKHDKPIKSLQNTIYFKNKKIKKAALKRSESLQFSGLSSYVMNLIEQDLKGSGKL